MEQDEDVNDLEVNDLELKYYNKGYLFIKVPKRHIGLDTVPADGHEFIYKSKLENAQLKYNSFYKKDLFAEVLKIPRSQLKNAEIEFAYVTRLMKEKRQLFKFVLPQSAVIPMNNEVESCFFCLGSQKCMEIYGFASPTYVEAHMPLISIMAYLKQVEIKKLIRYTFKWYKAIGMDNQIAKWLFALLACLNKPLSERQEMFLREYYDELKIRVQELDGQLYVRVRTLMALLENQFDLKLDSEAIATLQSFRSLAIGTESVSCETDQNY